MTQYYFTTIIEKDEDGYFVYCPELQGCYTQGDTYEEAMSNIQDAIRLHLEEIKSENMVYQPRLASVSLSRVEVAI